MERLAVGVAMQVIRVLLVDDDERYARTLATFLESHDDIEVVGISADGHQAIQAYERLTPTVVVMDAYMPQMDGSEATRAIKSLDPCSRVVMLTAHDTPDLRERGTRAGASAVVSKPNAAKELVGEIRAAAAERPQQEQRGSVAIDTQDRGRSVSEPEGGGAPGTPAVRPAEIVVTVTVSFPSGRWSTEGELD